MFSLVAILVLACQCEARPRAVPEPSFGNYIIGGGVADPGEWPWQLSMQRESGLRWEHSCGSSLLSDIRVLNAAHCVDGSSPATLRIIAGLHDQTDTSGTQTSDVGSYIQHEDYNLEPQVAYPNDVAIVYLETAIIVGGNVQLLTLPPDNSDDFAGVMCTLTGWGRISTSNDLPDLLQEVELQAITTAECDTLMEGVVGGNVWDNHICFYDPAGQKGSCNGDSGGPANCPDGASGFYVSGIASWVVSSSGNCQTDYPSVYTRTSAYIDWINSH